MAKATPNIKNLIPQNKRTKEEQRAIAKKGGIASGEARREKKRISQIYTDFLLATHEIEINEEMVKLEGAALLAHVMKQVLVRGDSASVSLLKEIREATEGSKIALTGEEGGPVAFEIVDPPKLDESTS